MNRHQKKALSLAAAIANLSFTVAVAGVATYAWFSNISRVDVTGMSVTTATADIKLDYKVLTFDLDSRTGSGVNNPGSFDLPKYDAYVGNNYYNNLIIRAEIGFPVINPATNEVEIDITKLASSHLRADMSSPINTLTSNVIQFKCVAASYTTDGTNFSSLGVISESQGSYTSVNDAMYQNATNYFAGVDTPTTFISVKNGQPVDPLNGNIIKLAVSNLRSVNTNIKGAVVYIECSYNSYLANGLFKENPSASNLTGDVTKLEFKIRDLAQESAAYADDTTGKYKRVTSVGSTDDGKYLVTYNGSNKYALDGSKSLGNETLGSGTGINANNNSIELDDWMATDQNSVYASQGIDDASLTFDRENGTFKTKNNHYIGTNTTEQAKTAGIVSNASSSGLSNTITYSGNNASIKDKDVSTMSIQYDSTNDKFAYYQEDGSLTKEAVSLYKYHENAALTSTLTGITVTQPTDPNDNFGIDTVFKLKGLSVTATYRRSNNTTYQISVIDRCTYTIGGNQVIPNQTVLTTSGSNQTVSVSYSDGGVSESGSYTIDVISDDLIEMEITALPTTTLYRVGEKFSTAGLVVTGTFEITGEAIITSSCRFKIGGSYVTTDTALNTPGDNIVVTVEYNGSTGEGYEDQTFNITVKAYQLTITEASATVADDNSVTIHYSFNADVTWELTNNYDSTVGEASFSENSTITEKSVEYTGSNYQTLSNQTLTIYGKNAGKAQLVGTLDDHETTTASIVITITGALVGDAQLYSGTITEGDYVIYYGGKAMKNTVSSNRFDYSEVTPVNNVISSPDKSIVWHIAPSSTYWTIYNEDVEKYAGSTSAKNQGALIASINDNAKWTVTGSSVYEFENLARSTGTDPSNKWLRNNGTSGFACYASSTGGALSLYKIKTSSQRFTVSFNAGTGGSGSIASVEKTGGSSFTLPDSTGFTAPSGKTFDYWIVNGTGYDNVHKNPGETIIVSSDITVTAVWINVYTITFQANGGSGTMASVEKKSGETYALPDCDFTAPQNKGFKCWSIGGTERAAGYEFTVTADVTVTAVWQNVYTVSYSAGDGTGTKDSETVVQNGTVELPLASTFTAPEGYTFDYWDVHGGTYNHAHMDPEDEITITANTTITAIWKTASTKTYTLTIQTSDFTTASYADNNGEHTTNAVAGDSTTLAVTWYSNQVMQQSSAMQWQKNNGYIYNTTDLGTIQSVTISSTQGTFTTYYGTSSHPTSGTTVGNGYFTVQVGNATGKTTQVVIVFNK